MTTTTTTPAFFTEGPCDDDDAPDCIREIREQRSLRARTRPAPENLDFIRSRLFTEVSHVLAAPGKDWTDAEDRAICAFVDEVLLRLCNGALLHDDRDNRPRALLRAMATVS